jgi:FAD/FMN-containing dehydrogenase
MTIIDHHSPLVKPSQALSVIRPDDLSYDDMRVVWNGMIDRKPECIVQCRDVADVIAGVAIATDRGLPISIRCGGHNVAGYAVCEAGVMLDLSAMREVCVDPVKKRTWAQGGARWGDVDKATTPFGLATPGGLISETGVGGLTLSGGIGWLRGKHGLCIDNLMAADVVLANGRVVHASETDNPDLLWALRGGGGNFGVVTQFEFALHPIEPELMFCAPAYPEERAAEILPRWRSFMESAPDEISGLAEFSTLPDDPSLPAEARGRRVISLATVYDGPAEQGERLLEPLRTYGEPLVDFSARMPYLAIQSLYDALFPKGRDRCYWKSLYLRSLDDAAINMVVGEMAARPSEMTFGSIWRFGGAMSRVAPAATAFGDRSMPWMLSIDAIWSTTNDDETNIGWVRRFWSAMQRHSTGRVYLNFPGLGEDNASLVSSAFGDNHARLREVKRRYDTANLFRMNQNIVPAELPG